MSKDGITDALKTQVNMGLILRVDLGQVPTIKEELLNMGVEIVYQTLTTEKLYVVKKEDAERCGIIARN